jgi:hypothetical protein
VRGPEPFELEERVRDGAEDRVMRPPMVRAALEVIEAEVVFEFAVLLPDLPSDVFPRSLHLRALAGSGVSDERVWELAIEHGCLLVSKAGRSRASRQRRPR